MEFVYIVVAGWLGGVVMVGFRVLKNPGLVIFCWNIRFVDNSIYALSGQIFFHQAGH